jgi:hypothetical protein
VRPQFAPFQCEDPVTIFAAAHRDGRDPYTCGR